MEENNNQSKSVWIGWIIAGLLFAGLMAVFLPAFIRARNTPATNASMNNLRQIDAAKQQWGLENNVTNLKTVVTWDAIKPYLGRGSEGSLIGIHCQDDKTKQYSNSYTLGNLNAKPKCRINPAHVIK